jgi:hypothetical protein
MYRTELHGKLPSELWSSEDLLTGIVFALFQYGDRTRFLGPWLRSLGLHVSDADAIGGEFRYWPQFPDGTEPDLLLLVGTYLILVEAKLTADFGTDVCDASRNQLRREVRQGKAAAAVEGREFQLITLTAELFPRSQLYADLDEHDRRRWHHVSWQAIAGWLDGLAESVHSEMSRDLLEVLRRRGLHRFQGFRSVSAITAPLRGPAIFFSPSALRTLRFRGFEALRALVVTSAGRNIRVFYQGTPRGRRRKE